MIDHLNAAATTLGYLVLTAFFVSLVWFTLALFRGMQHDWRKKRAKEKEWDNLQSDWLMNSNHDTDHLDFSVADIYDYEKERYRDAS